MFYGPGAGSLPTATSVVSDLVGCHEKYASWCKWKKCCITSISKELKTSDEILLKILLTIHVKDEVGVFAKITTLFC